MNWFTKIREKFNPVQETIAQDAGGQQASTAKITYTQAFKRLESVNRGVNMIVSACSSLDYDVKDSLPISVAVGVRQKSLHSILNHRPNPYQSVQEFRTAIFTDFILEGNIFLYFDGAFIYHLPAQSVVVVPDTKTFVNKYTINGTATELMPNEVIHIKDLSGESVYRGTSRLESAQRSIDTLYSMHNFQEDFFDNQAIPSLIFTTENTLSSIAKEKTIAGWLQRYSGRSRGSKRPMILDSGMKPVIGLQQNFQEMDFDTSIKAHDVKVLKALGVPPVLLDGGNQANISPNLRLFYLETVLPIVTKYVSAIERFFGYDVEAISSSVSALQPELKDLSDFYSSLVNGGILTPNEAREALRFAKLAGHDDIRIPANIAGSAANPSVGGAPNKPPKE